MENLDKYYGKYYQRLLSQGVDEDSIKERILDAGWVFEKYADHDYFSPQMVSNDFIEHIKHVDNLSSQVINPAIIMTTGSFDPMHDGHIAMMTASKKTVEINGYQVLSGVMSSGHDDYVRKNKTQYGVNGFERCIMSESFLENHQENSAKWIYHDNWESLIAPEAVNFTTVIEWIKTLVECYAPNLYEKVTLFYVFGADNANFSHSLLECDQVKPIVVERVGYKISDEVQANIDNGTVMFAENKTNISSTIIRQQKLNTRPYVIREDICLSSKYLKDFLGEKDYNQRIKKFKRDLLSIFQDRIGNNVEVLSINVDEQLLRTEQFVSENFGKETRFLSADKYFESENTISIQCSRVFSAGSEQKHADKIYIEKESVDPEISYVFIDDDIASGFTLEKLKKNYRITESISMLEIMVPYGVYDVVDERDFLLGAVHGGLLCETNGGYVRFPYMFPYVNLNTRASIVSDKVKDMSVELWKLNKMFYANTGLRVKDLRNNDFFRNLKVDANTEVEDFCSHMQSMLTL